MMEATAADSLSKPKRTLKDLMELGCGNLILNINQLKDEIEADRAVQIKGKLDKNQKKLRSHIRGILSAPSEVNTSSLDNSCEAALLGEESLCTFSGFVPVSEDDELPSIHQVIFAKSNKLPKIQRIPPYTTWIFLDRNQRMAEDQFVVGRKRIFYDESGKETLICCDSDNEMAEIEGEKRGFSEGEDRILWMAFKEHGFNDVVAEVVNHFIGGNPVQIQERFNELKVKSEVSQVQGSSGRNSLLEKSLSTALDSFDHLFCRRCLVFDCRLHGCAQNLIYPSEKPLSLSAPEVKKACSDQCYLLVRQTTLGLVESSQTSSLHQMNRVLCRRDRKGSKVFSLGEKVISDDVGICGSMESACGEGQPAHLVKRKITDDNDSEVSDSFGRCVDKKLKKIRALDRLVDDLTTSNPNDFSSQIPSSCQASGIIQVEVNDINRTHEWSPLEKDLYLKGLEIFGRNSCLIARNLLSGLKTCSEVYNYIHNNRASMTHNMEITHSSEDNARADSDNLGSRSKLLRKRGRMRRLKFSSKSSGHPSSWKKHNDAVHSLKQYTPCACEFMCGKDCPCQMNGLCCEKYCGCSRNCRNRFRGCYCAKSQCRTRQCPCFAANRECDPDVCRNCWVSCGGDSLGEPPKRGDGQCGNMKLQLRQQQRILLGRSDVAGWGAFVKNSVNKNDYLGEYTGELISHQEAERRGKLYEHVNRSYLFDLNDQYVLDAYRQGNKLKFANHSPKPNCYCKILLVAGENRIGIFANEHIEAKEEIFYDYGYGPAQAPPWAIRPESSKRGDSQPSQGRPRKHQSR